MVILLVGEFCQTWPVTATGTPGDQYYDCIKSLYFWNEVKVFHLTKNVRVCLHNDVLVETFSKH